MFDLYSHSTRGHLVGRHRSLHGHIANRMRLRLQLDGAHILLFTELPHRLVADVGDTHKYMLLLDGDHEDTAFIRNTAIEQGRILGIEHRNVGQSQRLLGFVHDDACEVTISFLHTFQIDLMSLTIHGHSDGIESYHLANSLGHCFVLDAGRYAEILQVII